jgi:hypothetical protein
MLIGCISKTPSIEKRVVQIRETTEKGFALHSSLPENKEEVLKLMITALYEEAVKEEWGSGQFYYALELLVGDRVIVL